MPNTSTKKPDRLVPGITFAVLSAITAAMMGATVKYVSAEVPTNFLVFIRFTFCLLAILPLVLANPKRFLKANKPKSHFYRSVTGFLSILLVYYSLQHLPLVNAMLLFSTAPLFVPFVVKLLFGVPIHKPLLATSLIGFIGIALVLHPDGEAFEIASIIALCAGISVAFARTYVRDLNKENHPLTIMFYFFLSSAVVSGVLTLWHLPHVTFTPDLIFWLLILGVVSLFYQVTATLAPRYIQVRIASPIIYYGAVVVSFFLQWWVWNRIPSVLELSGAALVITGAILSVRFRPA